MMGRSVPARLRELAALGQTLTRRAADVLVYFDRPRTINGHLLELAQPRRERAAPDPHPAAWRPYRRGGGGPAPRTRQR
jgi:hypothetical protein